MHGNSPKFANEHTSFSYTQDLVPAGFVHSFDNNDRYNVQNIGLFTMDQGYDAREVIQNHTENSHWLKLLEEGGMGPLSLSVVFVIHQLINHTSVYVNYPLIAKVRARKAVEKGSDVYYEDIDDIEAVELPEGMPSLAIGWSVIMRYRWNAGVVFDYSRVPSKEEQSTDIIGRYAGCLLNRMVHAKLLDLNPNILESMYSDGWFLFKAISKQLSHKLYSAYSQNKMKEQVAQEILEYFTVTSSKSIAARIIKHDLNKEHKSLVLEAISRHVNENDYLGSISILMPRVEGILRSIKPNENYHPREAVDGLVEYFVKKVFAESVTYPMQFGRYLKVFLDRDIHTGRGRHSFAHGTMSLDEFNSTRSMQLILIIDQMLFYHLAGEN